MNVLFDCDGGGASGVYLPELADPDHSCANASTMWEMTSLMVSCTNIVNTYFL